MYSETKFACRLSIAFFIIRYKIQSYYSNCAFRRSYLETNVIISWLKVAKLWKCMDLWVNVGF
jgi:hypothetical protein